jgi:hypothetical protein
MCAGKGLAGLHTFVRLAMKRLLLLVDTCLRHAVNVAEVRIMTVGMTPL